MIKNFILVGLGSFMGGGCRYLLSKWVQASTLSTFPFGTLSVNLLGCLFIGIFYALFDKGQLVSPDLKLFLTVGFCGGFTTFSTFINEYMQLIKLSQILSFSCYLGLSLAGGALAFFAGQALVRFVYNS